QGSLKGLLVEGQQRWLSAGRRVRLMIRQPTLRLGRGVVEKLTRELAYTYAMAQLLSHSVRILGVVHSERHGHSGRFLPEAITGARPQWMSSASSCRKAIWLPRKAKCGLRTRIQAVSSWRE